MKTVGPHHEKPKGTDSEETFRRIFDKYRFIVFGFFKKHGFLIQDCEDLVQQSFLQIYQSLGTFRHEVPYNIWIHRVATNVYRNKVREKLSAKRSGIEISYDELVRRQKIQETVTAAGIADAKHSHDPQWSEPLDRLLERECLGMLTRTLDSLPGQMRRCVDLRMQGYSFIEIGVTLGISPQTAKVQLFRARKSLKRRLAEHYAIEPQGE